MAKQHYLGMHEGDLNEKPYAKYWQPTMAALPDRAAEALLQGPVAGEMGFVHEQAGELLKPGYLPLETGYTRLRNGQVFVAVLTPMPGVSGKMIDWWFGWHGAEKERYKLWHPQAHVNVSMERQVADDPNLSDREKYVGNVSYVHEYIGDGFLPLTIAFNTPEDNHLESNAFEAASVSTAVCARTGFASRPFDIGRLIHLIRETDDGCEMRSRFWIGDIAARGLSDHNVINRMLGSKFVASRAGDINLGRDLVVHCAMEMQHLASFLPALYADYHPEVDVDGGVSPVGNPVATPRASTG
jgi:hypothetical protein